MIRVVFFDIGNTLAARAPDGTLKVFEPGSTILLRAMKSVLGAEVRRHKQSSYGSHVGRSVRVAF